MSRETFSRPTSFDALWTDAIEGLQPLEADARNLVVVAPHPDDETLGAGGLMASTAARGGAVTVLVVTDGELGLGPNGGSCGGRRDDLRRALHLLGVVAPRVLFMAVPAGSVADHEDLLESMLDGVLEPCDLLVGPWEHDGNDDHEATGRVCRRVAARHQLPSLSYPIWAWHHRAPGQWLTTRSRRLSFGESIRAAKSRAIACYRKDRDLGASMLPAHELPYFRRPHEIFLL